MPMAVNDLEWLGTWYQEQCNGEWEHRRGMHLKQLAGANGEGWSLRVDLRDTAAAGSASRQTSFCSMDRAEWLHCSLNGQQFEGMGDAVEGLVGVFRRWVEGHSPSRLEAASVL